MSRDNAVRARDATEPRSEPEPGETMSRVETSFPSDARAARRRRRDEWWAEIHKAWYAAAAAGDMVEAATCFTELVRLGDEARAEEDAWHRAHERRYGE